MADSAYETFGRAIQRAKFLATLYHGLIDQRQRSIRSPWAARFRDLMHWPKSHKIDRVVGRDAIIVLRDGASITRDDFKPETLSDLLRASLVMTVSAMDAYFHAKILASVVKCVRRPNGMPGALQKSNITIPEFLASQNYERPMHIVRQSLHRQLGYKTFQQPEKIAQGLALIGVKKFWNKIAVRMSMTSEGLEKRISVIVNRRNRIAHEGDLSQSNKARNKSNEIAPKIVNESIEFIERLVEKSELEVNQQLGL